MVPPRKKTNAAVPQSNHTGASQCLEKAPSIREKSRHDRLPLLVGASASNSVYGIGENNVSQPNARNTTNYVGNREVSTGIRVLGLDSYLNSLTRYLYRMLKGGGSTFRGIG